MIRNFNFTDYSEHGSNDAEETTNNSICDKEVRELLFSFNTSIYSLRDSIESFKISQGILNDQTKQEIKINRKEVKVINGQLDLLDVYTNNYDKKMELMSQEINKEKEARINLIPLYNYNHNILNEYIECFSKSIFSLKTPSEQISKDFLDLKRDLLKLYNSKDEMIEMMRLTNKSVEEVNAVLNAQLTSLEEEQNKEKFCIKCHQNFRIKEKDEKKCISHSGELKYYSCKSCGGDEYYSCCMKCKACCHGCKVSKHIAEH